MRLVRSFPALGANIDAEGTAGDVDFALLPLVVLADTPPAAFGTISGVRALSSMNWNVNFLTNDFNTEDGWWLMRSATRFIRDGYSSQLIQVWNSQGCRVMDSAQHIAIFQ